MVKLLTGSGSFDLSAVCSDPPLVASQAKWSIQLAAMETISLLDKQTCPVIMKMTKLCHYEDKSLDWYKHFFSHERGYRMQIWVSPGRGYEHIEILLYIMKGPYEEDLR